MTPSKAILYYLLADLMGFVNCGRWYCGGKANLKLWILTLLVLLTLLNYEAFPSDGVDCLHSAQ